jgi:DNA-binding MarR family transcriptional regulator
MVTFFPPLYPDEMLYSVCSRYHLWSSNNSYTATSIELFGKQRIVSIELPSDIELFCKQLSTFNDSISPEQILYKHTHFPFYQPFLLKEKGDRIKQNSFRVKGYNTIIGGAKIKTERLKFCKRCFTEDKASFGEAYWHRTHNVLGLNACYKHLEWLYESNINKQIAKRRYIPLSKEIIESGRSLKRKNINVHLSKMVRLANYVNILMNSAFPSIDLMEVKRRINILLIKKGYATAQGQIKPKFKKNFLKYYDRSFLSLLNASIEEDKGSWLKHLPPNTRTTTFPLRFILLILFLGVNIKDFFNKEWSFLPFGSGPWPCLNPAAEHYQQNVIKEFSFLKGSRITGVFSCTCGYIYHKFLDLRNETETSSHYVSSYGDLWIKELSRLRYQEKLTLIQLANKLKVSVSTIRRHLEQINKRTIDQSPKTKEYFTRKRDDFRKKILDNTIPSKKLTRSQLSNMFNTELSWLAKHDKDWLEKNLPKKSRKVGWINIDWNKKDSILEIQIKKLVKENLMSKERPIRISKLYLSQCVGDSSILYTDRIKKSLPRTSALIEKVTETHEEIQIRRVLWASALLFERNETLTKTKICKTAGMFRYKIKENVLKVIMEQIKKYEKKVRCT